MKQRVVLITGASSGIGKAAAKLFAEKNYITYATARRTETFVELQALGCQTLQLDVTDEASMIAAVQEIEAKEGVIDILINNAGYAQGDPLEELPMSELRRQFETNVFGLLRMSQLVLPAMRRQNWGRIINISSVGGEVSMPGAGAYTMSKYTVESLTDTLRFEVKSFGVQVFSIQPESVATNFGNAGTASFSPSNPDSPYAKLMESLNGLLKGGNNEQPSGLSPERIAQVILEAASKPHPRTRYKVGLLANMMPRVRRLLPDHLWDQLLATQFRMS